MPISKRVRFYNSYVFLSSNFRYLLNASLVLRLFFLEIIVCKSEQNFSTRRDDVNINVKRNVLNSYMFIDGYVKINKVIIYFLFKSCIYILILLILIVFSSLTYTERICFYKNRIKTSSF